MSRNKKLLIWSGIINIIATLFFVYCIAMILQNIDGFADEIKTILLEGGFTNQQVAEALNSTISEFITCAVACGVCAVSNFVFAFIKPTYFTKLKWLNVLLACVNGIIGMNIVSAIMVLVASLSKQPQMAYSDNQGYAQPQVATQPQSQMTSEQVKEQIKLKGMAEKIEIVKHLKAEGSISEVEYIKLIDEIIVNGVKDEQNN